MDQILRVASPRMPLAPPLEARGQRARLGSGFRAFAKAVEQLAKWVIDQYRVKEDKRSGIRSDPNKPDDPEYIVRLVGQVVRVSVETVKIVAALPPRYAPEPEARPAAG